MCIYARRQPLTVTKHNLSHDVHVPPPQWRSNKWMSQQPAGEEGPYHIAVVVCCPTIQLPHHSRTEQTIKVHHTSSKDVRLR